MVLCHREFIRMWIILSVKSCIAENETVHNLLSALQIPAGSFVNWTKGKDNLSSPIFNPCIPIMCGVSLSELLESPKLIIIEAFRPGLCSHLVIKVDLFDKSFGSLMMGERILRGLQIIRVEAYPTLPVILYIFDSHSKAAFQHLLQPSTQQDAFTSAIFRLMTFNNLSGIHFSLKSNSDSVSYPGLDDNVVSFVQYYSELCLANNWKLDVSLKYPFTSFQKRHTIKRIYTYVRYLVFSFDSSAFVSPKHAFPLHGHGFSIEDLIKTLDEEGVDMENVVIDVPFYARISDKYDKVEFNSNTMARNSSDLSQGINFNATKLRWEPFTYVCEKILNEAAMYNLFKDDSAHSYFLQGNKQSIYFEAPLMITEKVQYMLNVGVKTLFINDLHDDDFSGESCGISYPLLKSAAHAIRQKASCITTNPGGENLFKFSGSDQTDFKVKDEISANTQSYTVIVFGISGLVFGICLLGLYFGFLKQKMITSKSRRAIYTKNYASIPQIPQQLKDMEISCHEYKLEPNTVLGQGYYNVVVKGKIGCQAVAVKVPKRRLASSCNSTLQVNELEILHEVRGHQNIVGLLAFSTVSVEGGIRLHTFLEYCPLGSLDKYLKMRRDTFINIMVDDANGLPKTANVSIGRTENFNTSDYGEALNIKILISWALQICDGMEFVARKQIVHGDLAARNILLDSVEKIKICDFGLSCKMDSIQKFNSSSNEEAVPWRWMAVESLETHQVSITSDVWSYGVTCWEIFSLGEVPYAGLQYNSDFISDLKSGSQLAAPRYATNDIYETIMQPCWTIKYQDRPTFTNIKEYLLQSIHSIFSEGYEEVVRLQPISGGNGHADYVDV